MSRQLTINEAKAEFFQLIERAHVGEEIIVTKDGEPWARLVPLAKQTARQPGLLRELRLNPTFDELLPDDELNAWSGRR